MAASVIGDSGPGPYGGAMSAGEVERELARLRINEDGSLAARASALNLIVVTDEAAESSITPLLCDLSGRHPLRAVVVVSDSDEGEANLEMRLSAFCNPRSGRGVCAELITLRAKGPPAGHLESLTGPLLLPDLPVFLHYPNGRVPARSERGVVALADRLMLDSAMVNDCGEFFGEVIGLLKGGGPAVGDLRWAALSPWRSLVADLFAPPDLAGELERIKHVEVLYGGGESARPCSSRAGSAPPSAGVS